MENGGFSKTSKTLCLPKNTPATKMHHAPFRGNTIYVQLTAGRFSDLRLTAKLLPIHTALVFQIVNTRTFC